MAGLSGVGVVDVTDVVEDSRFAEEECFVVANGDGVQPFAVHTLVVLA